MDHLEVGEPQTALPSHAWYSLLKPQQVGRAAAQNSVDPIKAVRSRRTQCDSDSGDLQAAAQDKVDAVKAVRPRRAQCDRDFGDLRASAQDKVDASSAPHNGRSTTAILEVGEPQLKTRWMQSKQCAHDGRSVTAILEICEPQLKTRWMQAVPPRRAQCNRDSGDW